jgi:outer membrane scaffolding protein for murein synthesis (MipA/OmpV family)
MWTINPCTAQVALIAVVLSAAEVGAQPAQMDSGTASDWRVRLGLGASVAPKYLGGGESQARALPFIDAQYRDWLSLSVANGIEVRQKLDPDWTVGASLGVDLGQRREKDGDRLKGLPEIERAAVARVFSNWRIGNLVLGAEVRSRLGGDEKGGSTADLSAAMRFPLDQKLALMVGVNATAMDSRYARNFFGIDAAQSLPSGLPVYRAGSGWRDAGVFAQVMGPLSGNWSWMARVRAASLIGDAKSSPIVEDKNQVSAFAAAIYTFK